MVHRVLKHSRYFHSYHKKKLIIHSKKMFMQAQAAQFMSPQSSISRGASGTLVTSGGAAGTSGSGGAMAPAAAGRSRDISMGQLFEVFTLLCQQVGRDER